MQRRLQRVCLLLLFSCVVGAASAATLTARIDRSEAFLGDAPLVLTLSVDDANFSGSPDLQPLVTDFEVLGRPTVMSNTAYDNGVLSSRKAWEISLRPRRPGQLEIPPLTVGTLTSQPIQLTINQAPPNAVNAPDLQIRVQIDQEQPYVQQQVLYTLQILNAKPLSRDTEPRIEWPAGLVWQSLPRTQNTSWTQIGSRTFKVRTLRYALFPERSEELTIPGPRYTAWMSDSNSRSPFSRGKRVDVIGETVTLEVKPQPAAYSGAHWLPARQVELNEEWPQNPDFEFTVGEPVTWALQLKASGQLSTQLPELDIGQIEGARIYPDRTRGEDAVDGDWIGQSEARFAVVPKQPGLLMLPEVRVAWWDTRSDQQREAVIPAREVNVAPAADANAAPVATFERARDGLQQDPVASSDGWRIIALVLIALWAGTVIGWWLERRRRPVVATPPSAPSPSVAEKPTPQAVRSACQANDPAAAAQSVLAWARHAKPDSGPLTLNRLAVLLDDPAASTELLVLDQALYAVPGAPWSGDALWQALQKGLKWRRPTAASADQPPVLPALYPKGS